MKANKAARLAELASKTDAEKAQLMSIRERIENKTKTDQLVLDFKDNLGSFKVRFNLVSSQKFDEFQRQMKDHGKLTTDIDKLRKLDQLTEEKRIEFEKLDKERTEYLYQLLEAQSLDNLDAEFWRNGGEYTPGLLKLILNKLLEESASMERYLSEVKSFRG